MKKCNLVKDLIPLYKEDLLSDDSKKFVQDHLYSCKECKIYADEIYIEEGSCSLEKTNQLEAFKAQIKKRLRRFGLSIAFFLISICSFIANYFTSPIYFDYDSSNFRTELVGDRFSIRAINTDIRDFNVTKSKDQYLVEAYTTRWDRLIRENRGIEKSIQLPNDRIIYYSNKTGDAKVLNSYLVSGGMRELPRLALNFYFIISIAIVALIAIVFIAMKIFRLNTGKFKFWIMAIFIPAAFLIGFVFIKGLESGASYDIVRDLKYIMISGMSIVAFIISLYSLIKNRL